MPQFDSKFERTLARESWALYSVGAGFFAARM